MPYPTQLLVRKEQLLPPRRLSDYHAAAKALVVAEAQAALHDTLLQGSALTGQERALLEWVRNHPAVSHKKRFDSADAVEAYRKATAFEALVRAAISDEHTCEAGCFPSS